MSTRPILYSFRRCPYAMRARLAIAVSGLTCRLREVKLRQKPESMLQASPKGTVPVLVDELSGRVIEESLEIMLWALAQSDPAHWLRNDPELRAQGEALIAQNDGPFKAQLDRYKYPQRYQSEALDPLACRAQAADWLMQLEDRLARHRYLLDDHVSWADSAIFPFVRQFAHTDRDWFEAQPWPYLRTWLNDFLATPLFECIMVAAEPWQPGDPDTLFPVARS